MLSVYTYKYVYRHTLNRDFLNLKNRVFLFEGKIF